MTDIMLDLETMSTKSNASIIAIGAVAFNENGITSEFYKEISLKSCADKGLDIDANTVTWWLNQSKEAQSKFFKNEEAIPLEEALKMFSEWFEFQGGSTIWGNGATFDNVILRNACEVCGVDYPVKFWNDMCYRTVKSLNPDIDFKRVGVYHYALDDAKSQALHLIDILNK